MSSFSQSDAEAPVPVMPVAGDKIGDRFAVTSLACHGGMGAIYQGVELGSGSTVAIKFIGSTSSSARARFQRESRILADLSHPSVVQYLAHGTTPTGLLYLVMEWLEGEDLSTRLSRERRLGQEDALSLVRRVCEGLAEAHSRGIVHRDIKPANIFLERGDARQAKVLDFGVARLTESVRSVATGAALVGTVGYMAPEQVMCERDVDARADVFAIGCVLYECLTGRAPFASAHPVGVLAKVLREEPARPSDLVSDIDPRIDAFVSRLVAKSRADRPPNASAVLAELDRVLREPSRIRPLTRAPGSSSSWSEQRIVSVILGKPASVDGMHIDTGADELLAKLSSKFSVEIAPLQGGGMLLVLTGRGQANDRASQAALCALDLVQSRPDLTLAVATGLADTSGDVPFGAAIDRAAALLKQDTPTAAGIRVDDVTMGLIGLRFDVRRENDGMVLVGTHRDFEVPRLLMGRPTPHVGRDRELAMLDGVLDECIGDCVCRAVLVTGAPGIGKSRLVAEWLAKNHHAGAVRVLFARADPGSACSPLWLMQQLFRDGADLREADAPEVQSARLSEYLASCGTEPEHVELLTEWLGLRGDEEESQLLRAARRSPEIMQERIRRTLQGWLDSETAKQPVIVVLEDLHWGDAPSVSILTEALRERSNRPTMVLGLARPDAERQFPDFAEHAALRIRLQGLTPRAAEQLMAAVLHSSKDAALVARVVRTADGNPFYLEELIRRVAAGGTDWPDTVLAMAQSRIEELDSSARCALRAASVFGERAWDAGVQEMLGPELDAASLLAVLARRELLVASAESRYAGAREYRFRHALLRDAAYAMMTDRDRRASHGVASKWLESNGEKDGRILAGHFEAAGLDELARPWLVRAAKAAVDAGDIAGTIDLANRGMKMGATGVERGGLLLARAYAEAQRGDPNLEVTREALELLPVGTAKWWLALGTLIWGSGIQGRPEEAAPYVSLAQQAPFASEMDAPFGQGLVTLVGGLVLLGKPGVAELIVDRVGQASTGVEPDPIFDAFLCSARSALISVAPIGDKWRLEEAYFGGKKAIHSLRQLGAAHGESVALYYFAAAAIHLGRYEEAREACQRSVELTQYMGCSINDGWPEWFLARALLRLGQPDEALKMVSTLSSSPNRVVQDMLPVVVAEARFRQGNFSSAEAEAAPACSGLTPRLRRLAACILAHAQLAQGRPQEALSTVQTELGGHTSQGLETDIDLLTLRAEAFYATGQQREATEAIVEAADYAQSVAADINDRNLRDSFLQDVEPCARALSLSAQWADRGKSHLS